MVKSWFTRRDGQTREIKAENLADLKAALQEEADKEQISGRYPILTDDAGSTFGELVIRANPPADTNARKFTADEKQAARELQKNAELLGLTPGETRAAAKDLGIDTEPLDVTTPPDLGPNPIAHLTQLAEDLKGERQKLAEAGAKFIREQDPNVLVKALAGTLTNREREQAIARIRGEEPETDIVKATRTGTAYVEKFGHALAELEAARITGKDHLAAYLDSFDLGYRHTILEAFRKRFSELMDK